VKRLAPVGVAGAIGAAWAWDYSLSPASAVAVIGFHLAAGVALAWFLAGVASRLCPRAPTAGLCLAAFLALGLVPALASDLDLLSPSMVLKLEAVVLSGGAVLACGLGLLIARAGRVAVAATAALAAVAAVKLPVVEPVVLAAPMTLAMAPDDPIARRVAVIGIDGGDWRVIDPLLARGEMPHLAQLIQRGASGVLRAIAPLYSPVVWASIFTGKTPEKHGISDWYSSHAANRRAALLWDLLGGCDFDSIVVNVPGTWPPEVVRGELVSGFPIPAVLRPAVLEQAQVLGQVFTPLDRTGMLVPTIHLAVDGAGAEETVVAGRAVLPPRVRLRHYAIEALERHDILPPPKKRLFVRLEAGSGGRNRLKIGNHELELGSGAWSPWLHDDVFGRPVRFRLRALAGGGLYRTPLFQDPAQPMYPFASNPGLLKRTLGNQTYVVEGAGWRMADDRDLRDVLFEHLVDVEEQHLSTALRLTSLLPDWRLLVQVFTITDRASHAYWRYYQPDAYPPVPPDELASERSRVEDAYRFVDGALGRLLKALGDDVTVFVVSDHGFRASSTTSWGDHRPEGIWVAAGPGVKPRGERVELSVLDVTPTVLAALGLPVGRDMDGRPLPNLFDPGPKLAMIDTWESAEPGVTQQPKKQIDESTVDQLRSLGYVQ